MRLSGTSVQNTWAIIVQLSLASAATLVPNGSARVTFFFAPHRHCAEAPQHPKPYSVKHHSSGANSSYIPIGIPRFCSSFPSRFERKDCQHGSLRRLHKPQLHFPMTEQEALNSSKLCYRDFVRLRRDILAEVFRSESFHALDHGRERAAFEANRMRRLIALAQKCGGLTARAQMNGWNRKLKKFIEAQKRFQHLQGHTPLPHVRTAPAPHRLSSIEGGSISCLESLPHAG